LDEDGWKTQGKKGSKQSNQTRSPLTIWINGEDLYVLARMRKFDDEEDVAHANAFLNVRVFEAKYLTGVPSVETQVRTLTELQSIEDLWSMNMEERKIMYGHWQQDLRQQEAASASRRLSELRRAHAAVLRDMKEYEDEVSAA
jgi:hypothetical protein